MRDHVISTKEYNELKALATKAQEYKDAIETTITGMEWNIDNAPHLIDKADYQHYDYLRSVLGIKEECLKCEGKGIGYFSCCTGDLVDPDIQRCPKCLENLGEETCDECHGTKEVIP